MVLFHVTLQKAEHGTVSHIMPVYNRIIICHQTRIPGICKDTAIGISCSFKCIFQIMGIIPAVNHRIADGLTRKINPCRRIPIHPGQFFKID